MNRRLHPEDWEEEDITIRRGRGWDDHWDDRLAPEVDIALRRRSRSREPRGPPIIVAPGRREPEVVDALEDIRDEIHGLRRGRSRGPEWRDPSPAAAALILDRDRSTRDRLEREIERLRREDRARDHDMERQLEYTRAEIRRLEARLREDERDNKYKSDLELDRYRDDARKRSEERRRELEREKWRSEADRKEHEDREKEKLIIMRMEKNQREKEEEERRLMESFRQKEEDKKRKEEEMREKFKREEFEKKEKEKREKEEWRRRLEDEKRAEEDKKKKKEEELEEEMRKRLHRFGFQDNQIDVLVDPKAKEKHLRKLHKGDLPNNALVVSRTGPTLIRIHKNHLDIETLKYFKIRYEIDPDDTSYFIIYDDLEQKDTDILFEHTRKLRRKSEITIEQIGRGRHKEPQLAWVKRRPSASPSRRYIEEKVERKRSRSRSVVRVISSP